AVRERQEHGCVRRRDVSRHAVYDGVGMDVEVLAVTTPERRRGADRRGAVTQRSAAVGLVAEAEVIRATPFAGAARQILLKRDAVAFLQPPARRRPPADTGDDADVFVTQDLRAFRRLQRTLDIAAADTTRLDLEERIVVANLGQLELPQLELLRRNKD